MREYLRIPKIQMALFLLAIFITAIIHNPSAQAVIAIFIIVLSTIGSDQIFAKLRGKSFFFPSASLVSSLIIILVLSPSLPWYELMLTGMLAMFSKNFLKIANRHIFNPAVFGILTTAIIFNREVYWQAVSWQTFNVYNLSSMIFFIILLSPLLVSGMRMRRYPTIFLFLAFYTIGLRLINHNSPIINSFSDAPILFFSFVMLPEPMTSPYQRKQQIFFGIFVAIFALIISYQFSTFSIIIKDPLLFSLLIANALFVKFR